MKKIFWGYDPREVNESIEFLESQNESLNAKIANLNLEILAKNEQLSAKVESVSSLSVEEKNELTALRTKTESLNSENSRMQNECRTLLSKVEELEKQKTVVITQEIPVAVSAGQEPVASSNSENIAQVGELFQSVYSNITTVKHDASETMKKFILDYVSQLEASNRQLREVVSEINGIKDEVRDTFLDSVEEILGKFDELTFEGSGMEEKLDGVDRIKEELYNKIDSLTGEQQQEAEEIEEIPEVIEEESSLPPLLVKALNEKKGKGEVRKFSDDKSVIKNIAGKDSDVKVQ